MAEDHTLKHENGEWWSCPTCGYVHESELSKTVESDRG